MGSTQSKKVQHDEFTFRLMNWYASSAKTYTQTAMAALVLPIVFSKEVLGAPGEGRHSFGFFMVASWSCFLACIGCGLIFQWLAPKFYEIEVKEQNANWLKNNPGYVYGAMLIAFFLGAGLFTAGACIRLLS